MPSLVAQTSPSARETSAILKSATARLTNRSRGRDRKVRRESYDVADPRAQVFSRIADGTNAGGHGFIDDLVKLAREFDLVHRVPGGRAPLGPFAIAVLEVALRKFLDFKTGRMDPAIETIQKHTGFARNTVIRSLARLSANGFLSWVRRSESTGNDGEVGPQRAQTTNAYFFEHASRMARKVYARWRQLRERRAKRAAGTAPPATPAADARLVPADPALASALARMAENIDNASPR